jgi:NitT/TauT family transport system permease protein
VFAGIKTGQTLAIIGTIAAEFTGASAGVGTLVATYNGLIRVDYVLALVLTLVLLGWVAYSGMEMLDRRLTFWSDGAKHGR